MIIIARTVALYNDRETWKAMQVTGMKCDVSWERSAKAYASLYQSLLKSKA